MTATTLLDGPSRNSNDVLSDVDLVARYSVSSLPPKLKDSRTIGIYILRNKISGKMYIGSSDDIARRFQAHLSTLRRNIHHSFMLQYSWNFHGEGAFEFIIAEVLPSRDGLIEREQELINHFLPVFNLAACAENPMIGRKHRPDSIKKMKENRRGKGLGARHFSEQHRAALSAALKGKPRPDLRGRKRSLELRAQMSASALRKFAGGFVNGRTRPVELFGVRYASGSEAAKDLGITHTRAIRMIKRGHGRYLDLPHN